MSENPERTEGGSVRPTVFHEILDACLAIREILERHFTQLDRIEAKLAQIADQKLEEQP
jgi:hypothetical protein